MIYRAKRRLEDIEIAPGVKVTFAYGDLVDVNPELIDWLLANDFVEATDMVLPENDGVVEAEYGATQSVLDEIALAQETLDNK